MRRAAVVPISLSIAAGLCACHRTPPSAVVATVREARGIVERRQQADGEAWRVAAAGAELTVGDALRTGARSSARLELAGGGVVRLDENGRLRIHAGGGATEPALGVELGAAEIEPGAQEAALINGAASARLERNARVRIRADAAGVSYEVLVGRARIGPPSTEVALVAGQGVKIKIGGAIVDRYEVKLGTAVVEPPGVTAAAGGRADDVPDAGGSKAEAEAGAGTGAAAVRLERTDVTVVAGEDATLHDRKLPLPVRLDVSRLCAAGDASVELRRAGHHRAERAAGTGAVVLQLRAGTQHYRVWCAGDARGAAPRATGALAVKRDSGNVPLPRRAPANVIDADGRRYTVLYQSRLPALTLAWPGAPADAGALDLHLAAASGDRVVRVSAARHQFPSGALPEGTYTWWYQTTTGRESPKSTVTIRFDNAAPTVQFFGDAAAAAAPGRMAIDGVTMPGAKVSAEGEPLRVDEHGRFRAEVPLGSSGAVAVRLDHPKTGVHYYVRRRSVH